MSILLRVFKRSRDSWNENEDEDDDDMEPPPPAKVQKQEDDDRAIAEAEPGTLANLLPEVRQLIWRMLEFDDVYYLSRTCRWMAQEVRALQVPLALRTIFRPGVFSAVDWRRIVIDVINAAVYIGIGAIPWFSAGASYDHEYFYSIIWCGANRDFAIEWRFKEAMTMRVSFTSWDHTPCTRKEAVDAIVAEHRAKKMVVATSAVIQIPSL